MPEHYDVVIAGGGPAGLVAARTAAKEGGKVLLLELQAQIGGQTKSGAWVPSELIDGSFERAIVDSVESVVLNSPHETLRVEGDFGVIIDRSIFDKTLATKTAKENVEIWVGSPVKEILKDKNGVCGVRAEAGDWSESVNCEVVIDATGAQGKWSSLHFRQVLEKDWNEENLSQSNEYLMANAESESEVEIYFNSLLAPQGHAWNYPFSQDLVMTGIRGVRIHPDAALDEFIGRENPTILRDSSPIAAFRGQLPLEKIEDNYSDGIMAIGSAAGQVYPLSGHKTKYALEAGEISGRVAIDAITERNTSSERLKEYKEDCQSKFGKELKAGKILQKSLQTSPDRKIDSLLDLLSQDPELQENFIKVFLGQKLKENLRTLLKNKEVKNIFGNKATKKILSLYS